MTRADENKDKASFELSDEELKKIVAEADTGGRKPTGFTAQLLLMVALAWSLFQLWIASPLPFSLGVFVFNDTESRAIHLAPGRGPGRAPIAAASAAVRRSMAAPRRRK